MVTDDLRAALATKRGYPVERDDQSTDWKPDATGYYVRWPDIDAALATPDHRPGVDDSRADRLVIEPEGKDGWHWSYGNADTGTFDTFEDALDDFVRRRLAERRTGAARAPRT